MPTQKLPPEIITAAIQGFEFQKTSIDAKIAELRAMLPGGPAESASTPEPAKRKRRKISAAGRKAIAEAQRNRWAAARGESEATPPKATKPKRKLSAAAKAKLVANLKKARAAKAAKAKSAAAKKGAPKKAAVKKVAKKTAAKKKTATPAAPIAATTGQ